MLKQRVLTALLLLPLAMVAIFALPATGFLLLMALLLLAASLEYGHIAGLSRRTWGRWLVLVQATIFALLLLSLWPWGNTAWWTLAGSCIAWLLMLTRLPLFKGQTTPGPAFQFVAFITAIVSISTAWFALGWIRMQTDGPWLILLLLLIVWAADTGAYFSGKAFGKKKLAPAISPGKTLAGLIGGLTTAVLVAWLAARWMPLPALEPTRLALLALVTALVSVGGDLLVSLHKRVSGCKDSGNLLPGHGGILDRLDSLLAAAPFFGLGLLLMDI